MMFTSRLAHWAIRTEKPLCSAEGDVAATGGGTAPPATGAAGNDVAEFLGQIPENIRGEAYFKDIKDVGGLATRAFHQAKFIGKDPNTLVALPESDDPAAWAPVYDKLGRPAAPDAYKLEAPKTLPQGLTVDEGLQKNFTAKAHEIGLSQKQAAALYEWWNGERGTAYTAAGEEAKSRNDAAVRALQADRDFGGSAFEKNVQLGQAALSHYGSPELVAELERTGLGDHPQLVKMFAKIGRELAEDGLIGGRDSGSPGGVDTMAPAELEQQMNALRGNPQFRERYHSRDRAIRTAAIAEMNTLAEALAQSRARAAGRSE